MDETKNPPPYQPPPYPSQPATVPNDPNYPAPGTGQQPQANWMPQPSGTNCPPGLEYLTLIDQILIKQQIELVELMVNYESPNKYICYNSLGQQVYQCFEESDEFQRQTVSSMRAFQLHILDNNSQEVIRIDRPYKYNCCGQCCSCADCCLDQLEVFAPVGQSIGMIQQIYDSSIIIYHVLDANRQVVLQIHGPPHCDCSFDWSDKKFEVMSANGETKIGDITKQMTNTVQHLFTDADNFGVRFPLDLNVIHKALLLSAVFLIDFMYFEQSPQQGRQQRGNMYGHGRGTHMHHHNMAHNMAMQHHAMAMSHHGMAHNTAMSHHGMAHNTAMSHHNMAHNMAMQHHNMHM